MLGRSAAKTKGRSATLPIGATFEAAKMLEPNDAIAEYLKRLRPRAPESEVVGLTAVSGRILARDVVSAGDYPACARSTMDGFAIRAEGPRVRRIAGESRAGSLPACAISPADAMRVSARAVLPNGADTVVPIEDVEERGGEIVLRSAAHEGEFVTGRGADMRSGEVVLKAGRRAGGPELGVLAALGAVDIPVYRKPRVAIASTGDELVDPSERPAAGQERDSNRYAVAATLAALGCRPIHLPHAVDSPTSLRSTIRAALARADAVVVIGGTSVGDRDLTPEVIDGIGRPGVIVHGLRVKPGKPTVLAAIGDKPVIGLPGNPASALMIAEAVVAPIFRRLTGATQSAVSSYEAVAAADFVGGDGWTWYVPAALEETERGLTATPLSLRSSHASLLARAHGYAILTDRESRIAAGRHLRIRPFAAGREM